MKRRVPTRIGRDPLYDAVDQALPRRDLRVHRKALISALLAQIGTWLELAPQVRPYSELKIHCAKLVDHIRHVLADTEEDLRQLGVREADVIANQRLYRHTAESDLYGLCRFTMIKLGEWDRLWREPRKRGRRKSFAAVLTERLKEHCDFAGLSTKEFEDFLSDISNTNGLPNLSPATLRKRKQRGTKSV